MVDVSSNQVVGFLRSVGLSRRSLERNYTGLGISVHLPLTNVPHPGYREQGMVSSGIMISVAPYSIGMALKEGREEQILL